MARPLGLRGFLQSVTGYVGGLFDVQKIVNIFSMGASSGIADDVGVVVSHDAAMSIAALFRARAVLSGAFCATSFRLCEKTPKGLVPADGHPVDQALLYGLDQDMGRGSFLDAVIGHAAFKGNGYASLQFDKNGNFVNATLMNPDWVKIDNLPDGTPGYWYKEPKKEKQWLDEYEVLHFTGPSFDGRQGINWIEVGRRSLGMIINTERYGSRFFSKGYIFSGILNVPGAIKKDQEEQIRADLRRLHEGPGNSHGILMLKGEQKYQPNTAINPQDAQFLGNRSFNVYEISRWTNVPPSKLYAEQGTTYNGAEQEELDFRSNCLLPWVNRFKEEIFRKLIARSERGKYVITHDFQDLLSLDRLSAIRAEALAVNWGLSTPNESRRRLGLGLDLANGDIPMRPANMQSLDAQPGSAPGTGGPVSATNDPTVLPGDTTDPANQQQPVNDPASAVDLSLNGAQVTALQGIISDVAAGVISKDTGRALVEAAFPQLTPQQIDAIFAGIKEGSQPKPDPAQPAPKDPQP